MILLSQWYEPEDADRLSELRHARKFNESSPLFDECVYLDGTKSRRTFRDLFDLAATHYRDSVCVIANADITFEDGCEMLPDIADAGRLIALTRWEDDCSPRLLGHLLDESRAFFSGTQDSWVFVGDRLPHLTDTVTFGHNGCDQRIVGWAAKSGVEVIDPAIDIRSRHHHWERSRPQRESCFGTYGYPHLTGLSYTGLVLLHEWCADLPTYVGEIKDTKKCPR